MQTDSTFEKWLTTDNAPRNFNPDQPGPVDHTSRFPPHREVTRSALVDFISVLEHEVKCPLSIINLSVEILRTHPPSKDSAIYLDIIARNSLRIDKMISEMLLNPQAYSQAVEKYSVQQLLGTPT